MLYFGNESRNMIIDPPILKEIKEEWDGVRLFQSKIQRHLNAAGGIIGGGSTHDLRNISHNLTLLFAFSVLERTLKQLKSEGVFSAKSKGLENLMLGSKSKLPWQDYVLVNKARVDRNKVAHCKKTLERGECWKYIDAIEAELKMWKIVSKPKVFSH